jgi:galactokinase
VRALFEQAFGGEAAGVWGAPGRVNLIGEHTDYNAGLALPIALPQRTYVALRPRKDKLVRMASDGWDGVAQFALGDIAPGEPAGWARYPAGALWALRQAGFEFDGVDAAFVSEVPVGAGLSSSAAIEGSIALGVAELFELELPDTAAQPVSQSGGHTGSGRAFSDENRAFLAELCRQGENEIALAPTGGMDQAASLRCLAGNALLLDCLWGTATPVPFDLSATNLVLLVVNTRAQHTLSDGQYGARRADCEQACRELALPNLRAVDIAQLDNALAALSSERLKRRVRHVVTEIDRVRRAVTALELGDFSKLGRLFVASHESLRIDYEVSSPELDEVVRVGLACGALGARMTGGGFGGSAIVLLASELVDEAKRRITAAFVQAGFPNTPEFLLATPAAGASRVTC